MRYDLIIVGGGMVGAALAVALQNTSWKIALIDARIPDNNDQRLFALNHSSCQLLANLNLWNTLKAHASPIHEVQASYQGRFGAVRLSREEAGLSFLGHVIPSRYIETALNDELTRLSNITFYRPAKLKTLTQTNESVNLVIESNQGEITLTANFVVGADGAESTVRKQLDIPIEEHDYHQQAIVTRTKLKRSHQQIAYERFNAHGAIAMLPLVGNECATIWSADTPIVEELMKMHEPQFLQKLQESFGYRLGQLQEITPRFVYPLRMIRAKKCVVDRVMLLGNSAHTLHPVAAQGFNLALYEVAVLAEKISSNPFFSVADLQHVSDAIHARQSSIVGASHRMTQLFSHSSLCINMLMPLGMTALNIATPIKKKFINMMAGRAGSVPHLLLGGMES